MKKTILIADDSELNREMLTEILGDTYDYLYAADGDHVLNLLDENLEIDMLLLDMHMPKMPGMDVLKAMKEHHWTEEIPVIIISAEDDMGFIQNAYHLGAVDYIVRPFNAFLIQHRVKNTLTMYSQNKRLVKLVESQVLQREKMNSMLINIFSHVVGVVSNELGGHTLRIQTITNLLLNRLSQKSERYRLSETEIAMISSISALHDIGKVTIPDEIINKPGRLTPEEWEIMKSHTLRGDEMLSDIPVNQSEKMMVVAHEICRYHHERYDGNGYPDGLKGDEIPISAQVVSLADVYDALTSERVYKKAYTHEEAVGMIQRGECGVFNPLLIRSFLDISDDLLLNLQVNAEKYGYINDAKLLADEAMENEEVLKNDRSSHLVESEREKKKFFAGLCGGIQFEYDAVIGRVNYIHYYNDKGEKIRLSTNNTFLLGEKDWILLRKKVSKMTRENPIISMTVLVPVDGNLRWHKLVVKSIWIKERASYAMLIGQFTDVHEEMIRKGEQIDILGKSVSPETIVAMRDIFDVVRLVDPLECQVLKITENGEMTPSGQKCYEIWNRKEGCVNCSSAQTLKNRNWMTKLEIKDGQIYSVLSRYAKFGEKDCVLEVALCMEDNFGKAKSEIGFLLDSYTLHRFYRDTLTKAYSRAYLDSFQQNFEDAQGVAVVDINNFKGINDTYGHIIGDAALKHIAKVIRSSIRKDDVLIRYGGDEFLLVFQKIGEKEFFEKMKKIKQLVDESVLEEHPNLQLGISIGGAYCVTPLLRAIDVADKAMYRDKFKMTEDGKEWN